MQSNGPPETELPPTQKVVFKDKAHAQLLAGADILASAVASTMGPSGHSVIIDNPYGAPSISKDGVTVARAIHLKDRMQSMGAELLKEVAAKTNDLAGDGPQPLHSKVLTPFGWTTMGKLKVGEEICGTEQTTQKVLAIFPKGSQAVYEITTSDGRTAECCENHVWRVTTYYGKTQVLTTKQLLENGLVRLDKNGNKRTKYYLPTTCTEFVNSKLLTLDPYLLGALLGDGCLTGRGRTNVELSLGLHEDFILDKMVLPEGCGISKKSYYIKNYLKVRFTGVEQNRKPILKKHLSKLGLLGVDSSTKFIPKCYLHSSVLDREKLLAGLVDTGGHINKRGMFEFGTVSKQLHLDFIDLCRSLGKQIYSYKTERKPGGSFGTKPIYRVCELKGYKHGLKIKKIAMTNRHAEMQCIKVSNPDHLYITDDYVVTHNTTTATVLAHALLKEGVKQIATGRSAIQLRKGMEEATKTVIEFLKSNCIPVGSRKDIVNVGTISSNGDREIGELIALAIEKVGKDGIITVEPAKSVQTTLEVVEGMQLNKGYISPFFVTNSEKSTCELENPYVLSTSSKISSLSEIMSVLDKILKADRPLLIIADGVEGDALHTLIVNKMKGVLNVCAVTAPSYGEHRSNILDDLSKVIGGEVFGATSQIALKKATLEHLGQAKKVVVTRKTCIIIGDPADVARKEQVHERIASLRTALETDTTLDDLRISKYKERLAKLSGGIAIIKVGGSTEVEIFEKKDRVEDAVNATMAATQEGIVPGGGVALFYASQALRTMLKSGNIDSSQDDVAAGVKIIANICEYPIRTIVKNTGQSPDVILNALQTTYKTNPDFRVGYNAATGTYRNLIDEGIIDPVKVTRYALSHAVSVIGLVLTCNCVIVNEEQ